MGGLQSFAKISEALRLILLLVSRVWPKGVDLFDHIDGIWVLDPKCIIPLAVALRQISGRGK
jgi:hypothetical protein